eukprot:5292078-Pleurochrysis_carterae.AAC.1
MCSRRPWRRPVLFRPPPTVHREHAAARRAHSSTKGCWLLRGEEAPRGMRTPRRVWAVVEVATTPPAPSK